VRVHSSSSCSRRSFKAIQLSIWKNYQHTINIPNVAGQYSPALSSLHTKYSDSWPIVLKIWHLAAQLVKVIVGNCPLLKRVVNRAGERPFPYISQVFSDSLIYIFSFLSPFCILPFFFKVTECHLCQNQNL